MDDLTNLYKESSERSVSAEALRTEMLRRRYALLLEQPEVFPSQANWDFIIEHTLTGIGEGLYRKYLVSAVLPEEQRRSANRLALREFPRYLRAVDRSYAIEVVYDDTVSAPEATRSLVEECELFDAPSLLGLVRRCEAPAAVDMLEAFQPQYTAADLADMRELLEALRTLPELGEMADGRGLLRRDRRYICPAGHSNDADAEYCTHAGCGLNIYGLTEAQTRAIEAYAERVDALADLIQRS